MNANINEWSQFFSDLRDFKDHITLHLVPVHETFRFSIQDTISIKEMESQ